MPNERPHLAQVLLIRSRGILSTHPIRIPSPGRDPPETHRDGFLGFGLRKPSRLRGMERRVERGGRLQRESVHSMRRESSVAADPSHGGNEGWWGVSISRLHSSVFKYHQPSPSHSQEAARTRPRTASSRLPGITLAGGSQSLSSFSAYDPPPGERVEISVACHQTSPSEPISASFPPSF